LGIKKIAIIGDRFMKVETFSELIRKACGSQLQIRGLELPWPDEPMEHGYSQPGLDGLKEYMGDPEKLVEFIGDSEILVNHLAPVSAGMLNQLPGLKLIVVSRGGPVNIDMKAVCERGIQVVNVPGRNSTAVAEFTIGAILVETRLIRVGHEALRQGNWRGDLYRADVTGRELCQMTVGLIGYGHVGTKVVKLLQPFGSKILVCDPYVHLSEEDRLSGVEQVDLDELLSQSDVVSLHARVTEETTGFLDAAAFRRMRPGAYFINTARGPMVDYDALYEALTSGHLRGAMLETFGIEPVPAEWPLLKLPNVTLTPHIAGASLRTVSFTAEQCAEEVRRYLAGEPQLNPC
jgi:D-3-phosphoglycerate dehydrogenase